MTARTEAHGNPLFPRGWMAKRGMAKRGMTAALLIALTAPAQAEPTPNQAEPTPAQAEPTPAQAEPTPNQAEHAQAEHAQARHAIKAGHAGSPEQLLKRRRTARVRLMAAESRGATAARDRAQELLRSGKAPDGDGLREARRQAKWQALKAAIGDNREPNLALTNELLLHSKRVAKLARISALAEADGNGNLLTRAETALARERARHAARIEAVTEALALAPTPPEPSEAHVQPAVGHKPITAAPGDARPASDGAPR